MATSYEEPVTFLGTVTFAAPVVMTQSLTPPNGSIGNNAIADSAEIAANKTVHRHSKCHFQVGGTDVVDETVAIHIARAAGTIKSVVVRPLTAPTGGDKQFTVDVKKIPSGTAITGGTSLLSTPLAILAGDANNTNKPAVLAGTPTYAVNEMIVVVIDATGSTGSQGQGIAVEVHMDESGI